MGKQNCWEVKNCGRQPGGANVASLGVCPASVDTNLHGVHGGKNGGRACWIKEGTLCGGQKQGSFAMKAMNCSKCEFYKSVRQEEGSEVLSNTDLLKKTS